MADLSAIRTAAAVGIAVAAAMLAAPALAGTFVAPKGCTAYLTVQQHGCIVSNHYRCEQDAPGDQWRADFNANGPFFVSRIDSETQWVESYDLATHERETLAPDATDPASFTELMAKGIDSYDFSTVTDSGARRHYAGFDKLTGSSVVVDGVTLPETQFDLTARDADGKMLWHSAGNEFVAPKWRIFLSGEGTWEDDQGKTHFNNRPVKIVLPGQPGFGATVPVFDCNTVMSSLPLPSRSPLPVVKASLARSPVTTPPVTTAPAAEVAR